MGSYIRIFTLFTVETVDFRGNTWICPPSDYQSFHATVFIVDITLIFASNFLSGKRHTVYCALILICFCKVTSFQNLMKCYLQCSEIFLEARSDCLRWLESEQFCWLACLSSQSQLAWFIHYSLSERTSNFKTN